MTIERPALKNCLFAEYMTDPTQNLPTQNPTDSTLFFLRQ